MLTDADSQIALFLPKLESLQATKEGKARFVQILPDTADWSGKAAVSDVERSALTHSEVHEYEGPQGRGWSLIARAEEGGAQFQRVIHYGAEKFREMPWTKIVTPSELVK